MMDFLVKDLTLESMMYSNQAIYDSGFNPNLPKTDPKFGLNPLESCQNLTKWV